MKGDKKERRAISRVAYLGFLAGKLHIHDCGQQLMLEYFPTKCLDLNQLLSIKIVG